MPWLPPPLAVVSYPTSPKSGEKPRKSELNRRRVSETSGGQGRRFGGLAQMLEEASDVLWLLHQGLEFHAPPTLGAFLNVLGEGSFEQLTPRAIKLTSAWADWMLLGLPVLRAPWPAVARPWVVNPLQAGVMRTAGFLAWWAHGEERKFGGAIVEAKTPTTGRVAQGCSEPS